MTVLMNALLLAVAVVLISPTAGAQGVIDHFKCYKVRRPSGEPRFEERTVTLADQFGRRSQFPGDFEPVESTVVKPKLICNPVDKNGEGILNLDQHLLCYGIRDSQKSEVREIEVSDQFGEQRLLLATSESVLCVPATKRWIQCQADCDCPQAQFCNFQNVCTVGTVPVYCCDKPGCVAGEQCVDSDGETGICTQ